MSPLAVPDDCVGVRNCHQLLAHHGFLPAACMVIPNMCGNTHLTRPHPTQHTTVQLPEPPVPKHLAHPTQKPTEENETSMPQHTFPTDLKPKPFFPDRALEQPRQLMTVMVGHKPTPENPATVTVYTQVTAISIDLEDELAPSADGTLNITGGEAQITAHYAAGEWLFYSVGKY